jgi:hypothetical protein
LVFRRILKAFTIALVLFSVTSPAGAWGQSVHHDQATDLADAFNRSLSIPAEIRKWFDSDTIYALSLAPDDWREVTDVWGTYQYNMVENAYYELQRIRTAWSVGDFDNAIARVGILLHYIGDAVYQPHNQGIRDWYEEHIEPLGSEEPLWGSGEGGGMFSPKEIYHNAHYNHQTAEAYTDSDSNWIPTKPENYGPSDDGSLDYFLSLFWSPGVWDNDYVDPSDPSFGGTIMEWHIAACNPYIGWSDNDRVDNRWFYWLRTRDPSIVKQDADNTLRLVYNGVYRAIRDGEWYRRGGSGPPPADWSYWPWPTTSRWLSLDESWYGEGMDTARYVHGITAGAVGSAQSAPRTWAIGFSEVAIGIGAVLVSVGLAGFRRKEALGVGE